MATESDVKLHISEPSDNIKLSRSQYIATSTINYGTHMDNMFAFNNFAYALCRQLSTVITSNLPIPCQQTPNTKILYTTTRQIQ